MLTILKSLTTAGLHELDRDVVVGESDLGVEETLSLSTLPLDFVV